MNKLLSNPSFQAGHQLAVMCTALVNLDLRNSLYSIDYAKIEERARVIMIIGDNLQLRFDQDLYEFSFLL